MQKFKILILLLLAGQAVQAMDSKKKLWIESIDYRSYNSDSIMFSDGHTEEGRSCGVFIVKETDLWKKLQDGSNFIIRGWLSKKVDNVNDEGKPIGNGGKTVHIYEFDPKWTITESDIPELNRIYNDATLSKASLNKIAIRTALSSDKGIQKVCNYIKDKALYHVPLLLCVLVPDITLNKTNGFIQGVVGGVACGAGAFVLGEYGYPIIDSYNSGVGKLSAWFGPKNYHPIKRGMRFSLETCIHYFLAAVACKLLSYQEMSVRGIGFCLHILRLVGYGSVCYDLRQYEEPFDRSSSQGLFYTLGDLFNGPSFKI